MSNNIYKPPAHIPSETEHKIAWLNYCLDRAFDHLIGIDLSIEHIDAGREVGTSHLKNEVAQIRRLTNGIDEPMWANIITFEQFKITWGEMLADEHNGDCRKLPASCTRCYAEHLYGLLSTVTWRK